VVCWTASDNEYAHDRDDVARKMMQDDIAQAEEMVRNFQLRQKTRAKE